MTVVVNNWFPSSIYVAESIVSSKYNDLLKQKSLEIGKISENGASNWQCNTYNTLGTFDVKEDPLFSDLLKEIEFHVKKFTEMHGSDYQYKCKESWLNLNDKNSYQEYHCHSNSTFSAVYYISTPPKSGKIYFENPCEPDMLPIKEIKTPTEMSFRTCSYQPEEGTLLIFRSYMRHMVEICKNDSTRITIALNF